MAQSEGTPVKRDEIVGAGEIAQIVKDFQELEASMRGVDEQLLSIGKHSKETFGKPMKAGSAKELAEVEKQIKKVNLAYIEADQLTAKHIRAQTQLAAARRMEAAESERQAKAVKNQSNAYKELEQRTRELKNESKRLGAEMIALSESGRKNTKEYKELEFQYKETTKEASRLDKQLKKLDTSVGDNFRKVGMYERALNGLRGMAVRVVAALGLMETIRFVAGREVQLQRLQLALKNVTDTTNQYNAAIRYTRELSDKYGQDLLVVTDTYKSFIASSKSSGLALGSLNKIYESVIKSSSSLGLSTDQTQGALLAINQMFSKGTVQAEELRGQLGERLPGAFELMAKGLGVTTKELGKMLEKGEVLASEALPKFAEQLELSFGANAQENIKTVGGAWNRLKNTVSESVNDFNNANGVTQKLAAGINFLADNFKTIVKTVYELGKAFVIYKSIQATLKLRENYDLWRKYGSAVKDSADATGEAASKGKAFGNAIKGIGITLLITALTELALKFWDVASGAEAAREQHEALQNSINKGTEYGSKYVEVLNEALEKEKNKLELQKSSGKISEKEYTKEVKRLNDLSKLKLKYQIEQYQLDYKDSKLRAQRAAAEIKALRDQKEIIVGRGGEVKELSISESDERFTRRFAQIDLAKREMAENQAIINELRQAYKDIDTDIIRNQITINEAAKSQKEIIHQVNTEIKEVSLNLENLADLVAERKRLEFDEQVRAAKDAVDDELTEQLRLASETGEIRTDLLDELINKEHDMRRKAREQQFTDEVLSEKRKADEKFNEAKKQLEESRDERLKQEKLTSEDRREIEANYLKELEKLQEERVRQSEITGNKIVILELELKAELSELDKQRIEDLRARNNELIDAQIDYYAKKNELDAKNQKTKDGLDKNAIKTKDGILSKQLNQEKSYWKEAAEIAKSGTKALLDYRIQLNERLADNYSQEAEMAKKNYDYLQELAKNGNIQADQSLASQQAKIDEATKKKIEAQKRVENLKQVEAAYNILVKNLEATSPPSKAIAKTAMDVASVQALMGSLKGFYSGTKRTVADEFGAPLMPGRDGYVIRVDGSEKILNPENSRKTGDMTTDEIADLAYKARTGQLINPVIFSQSSTKTNDSYQFKQMISELRELKQVIKDNPVNDYNIAEILRDSMTLIHRQTKGNMTITNKHQFRMP